MSYGMIARTPFPLAVCGLFCLALCLVPSLAHAFSPFASDGADGVGVEETIGAPPPKRGGFAPNGDVAPVAVPERPAAPGAPASRAPKPFQPPKLLAPRVLGMYPDELTQGTSYSVTLTGENLNPTLKADFGAGILVKGAPSPLYGGKLKVNIDVLSFAETGKRKLKIGTAFIPPGEQEVAFEVKQKLAMAPEAKPVVSRVKLPVVDLTQVYKGVILLDAPTWRKQVGSTKAEYNKYTGDLIKPPSPIWETQLATIDDALLFVWHEQNQGLSERFEIRFFKGDRLLAKRSLPVSSGFGWSAIPHYRPDAALLEELFRALKQPAAHGQVGINQSLQVATKPALALGANSKRGNVGGAFTQAGSQSTAVSGSQAGMPVSQADAAAQLTVVGSLDHALLLADISWEVAGFRQYAKSGVAKSALADLGYEPIRLAAGFAPRKPSGKGGGASDVAVQGTAAQLAMTELVDVEVAISERWPLYLPDAPTGLACPDTLTSGLDVFNQDSIMEDGKLKGVQGFAYDSFVLVGTMDLARSPYAAHVDTTQTSVKPNPHTTVVTSTTWNFDNVFVDWGDGTHEPLAASGSGDTGDYARGDAVNLIMDAGNHVHRYTRPGRYIVRLYQLGEDDIQGGGQQVAALATDQGAGKFSTASLYQAALNQGGGAQAAHAETEYGKVVANRAYMVFCKPLTIQHRTDPDASGPLKLVDIAVRGVVRDGVLPAPEADAAPKNAGAAKSKAPAAPHQGKGGSTKAGTPQTGATTLSLDQVKSNFHALALLGGVPAYTTCDYQLTPYGLLHYTGQGKVRTRWYVDNHALPADAPVEVGPSWPRPDAMLKNPPETWGPSPAKGVNLMLTTPIGLDRLGAHQVRVEAEVVLDSAHLSDLALAALVGDLGAKATLADAAKQGALPKLGVLAVPKVPVKGGPGGGGPGPVMNLMFHDPGLPRLAAAGKHYNTATQPILSDAPKAAILPSVRVPPYWAVSEEQPYQVVGSDPSQPCTFDFPVSDGVFKVVGLQVPGGKPKVTRQGDRYSGAGDLLVPIPGGGTQKAALDFSGWQVAEDGLTVLDGQFTIAAPGLPELLMPALQGRFSRLDGVAGSQVDAWLDARLANIALKEVATASNVPRWQGVKASLSPDGDWYAEGQPMPEFLVYDSGGSMKPASVTLDLSTRRGGRPGAKCIGGGGDDWRGIALGTSDLLLSNFNMAGETPRAVVSNWGIDGDGLCGGPANTGPAEYDLLKGKLGWDDIEASAGKGTFSATYKGPWVYVPWLDTIMTGESESDPVLMAGKGQGQGNIGLPLTGQPKTLQHGPVTLRAEGLAFTWERLGPGANPPSLPAAKANTCFDFQGESQVFAKDVCVGDLYFAFDGKAYFKDVGAKPVNLVGRSGKLGQGTVTLKEVNVRANAGGDQRLGFDFSAGLRLSQELSADDGSVSYQVNGAPATPPYSGAGPQITGFDLKFSSKLVKASIKPDYAGPGGGVASNPVMLALADLGYASDAPLLVALSGGETIVFRGSVDLTQFNMAGSMSGTFLLGYHGDIDFWATRFDKKVPPPGIVLVSGVLSLYEFGGGLGYNIKQESLIGGSLDDVQFIHDSTPVLNATVLVGSGFDDGFTFAARGNLNIKPGGDDAGVSMNYTAWLLTHDHGGSGPISGKLGYGGGVFSGEMGGQWGPPGLDSHIYVQADPTAIGFSVGGDEWYFRAGTSDHPITGHVLILDRGAWLNLSKSGGLHVGAKANKRFPPGGCDGTCGYVEGWLSVDAGINLDPIRFSAHGGGGVSARGCIEGDCINFGTSVDVYAAAPNPLKFNFEITLELPCYEASMKIHILPKVKFDTSDDFCLW